MEHKTEKRILLGEFKDYHEQELVTTTKVYLVADELWIKQKDHFSWKEKETIVVIDSIHWDSLADCIITGCNILTEKK
jgi:hypothetical protein